MFLRTMRTDNGQLCDKFTASGYHLPHTTTSAPTPRRNPAAQSCCTGNNASHISSTQTRDRPVSPTYGSPGTPQTQQQPQLARNLLKSLQITHETNQYLAAHSHTTITQPIIHARSQIPPQQVSVTNLPYADTFTTNLPPPTTTTIKYLHRRW